MPAPGALAADHLYVRHATATTYHGVLTNSVVNLYWPTGDTRHRRPPPPCTSSPTATTPTTATATLPTGVSSNHYLGSRLPRRAPTTGSIPTGGPSSLQRIMNLTTVRTHQYAVWITIGFFEVKQAGRPGDAVATNPQLAFDIMGPEVGAVNGKNVRYRGFFLVDRLKLTGFNPHHRQLPRGGCLSQGIQ